MAMRHATATWAVLGAAAVLITAGCGGSVHGSPRSKQCRAVIGLESPVRTSLGSEQLAFARLAVADDNSKNGTKIGLEVADTEFSPSRAVAVSEQLVARSGAVAVIGPAGNAEVEAVGPIFARAGLPFISASATGSQLTAGANPTFFRVVPPVSLEGSQESDFIIDHLRPRAVLILDDRSGYGRRMADSMLPVFRLSRVLVERASANGRTAASAGALLDRITPAISVTVLAWHAPGGAETLGRMLVGQHRALTLVGPDRLFAPGQFTVPGAYVAAPGPDITALPADASIARRIRRSITTFGIFGPLAYAATHVVDEAVAQVCRSGQTPSASDVMAAVRATHAGSSILGIPIRFRADGELADPRWFMFRIDSAGRYHLVP